MKKEKQIVEENEGAECETCVRTVEPITVEFGREDLNLLRDKLNEVISKL